MKGRTIYQFCKNILYKIHFGKQKKQKVFILEDQYAPKIACELLGIDKNLNIPIVENIFQPMDFLEKISENDIILLDNYFKTKWWEEPYGDEFLQKLLQKFPHKTFCIICISDRWKRLCEWYNGWKMAEEKWWIRGWCTKKEGKEIYTIITHNIWYNY